MILHQTIPEDVIKHEKPELVLGMLINEFEKYEPENIWGLYVELEYGMQKFHDAGKFEYDKTIHAVLEDGSILEFSLCSYGATMKKIKRAGQREIVVVGKDTLAKIEKHALKRLITTLDAKLGHPVPDEFFEKINKELRAGDILTFTDAGMYLCLDIATRESGSRYAVFQKCLDSLNIKNFSYIKLKECVTKQPRFTVELGVKESVQDFYNKIKSTVTGSVIPRICPDINTRFREYLQKISKIIGTEQDKVVKLEFQKQTIFAKKIDKKLAFFDESQNPVSKVVLYLMYAFAKTSPITLTVFDERENVSNYQKACEEFDFRTKFETASNDKNSVKAISVIEDFCKEKGEEVSVTVSGFTDADSNCSFDEREYIFTEKDGVIKIFKKDMTGDTPTYVPCPKEEVIDFICYKQECERKRIKLQTAAKILADWKYAIGNSQSFERMVDIKSEPYMKNISPLSFSDIKVIKQDVSAYINAINDKEKFNEIHNQSAKKTTGNVPRLK